MRGDRRTRERYGKKYNLVGWRSRPARRGEGDTLPKPLRSEFSDSARLRNLDASGKGTQILLKYPEFAGPA